MHEPLIPWFIVEIQILPLKKYHQRIYYLLGKQNRNTRNVYQFEIVNLPDPIFPNFCKSLSFIYAWTSEPLIYCRNTNIVPQKISSYNILLITWKQNRNIGNIYWFELLSIEFVLNPGFWSVQLGLTLCCWNLICPKSVKSKS